MPVPQALAVIGSFVWEVTNQVLSDKVVISSASSLLSNSLSKMLTPSQKSEVAAIEKQSLQRQEELIEIRKKLAAIEVAATASTEQQRQNSEAEKARQGQVDFALRLREQELQILEKDQVEKDKLSRVYLQILQQSKRAEIDAHIVKIQADWDQVNWSGVLSRAEMHQILVQARNSPRLLMLVSPPNVEDCSEFDVNLEKTIRGELKLFVERNYPIRSNVYPVEFYGKFFKRAVFDIEIRQYEKDLAPIPTVIMYSEMTDEKIFFYIHSWGFPGAGDLSLSWDWLKERERLEKSEGKTREESRSIIREAIVKLHKLLAAFWSDFYYLQINPHHKIRLFQLEEEFPVEWAQLQFEAFKIFQQEKLADYRQHLAMNLRQAQFSLSDSLPQAKQEITVCFLGKTGSGKSTLINAFYNWCLGVDGKSKTERKYCISTRSKEGKPLEAEEKFLHLNTENNQRAKGASATQFSSKYTFETDEHIFNVVDTPGFADTSGIAVDQEHMRQIIEQIIQLNQVNVFGIVWNEKRLTAEQRFVVGCLQELLPKNGYKNIVVCVTNTLEVDADTKDAIAGAGLEQCPLICFDNLWVTAENWGRVDLMFRTEAETSFGELIECAKKADPVSSEIFQSIKRKRNQLEDNRTQIFGNIATLNDNKRALRVAIRELSDLSKDISNIQVRFTKVTPKETPARWNTTCSICAGNCHVGCGLEYKTQDYSRCSAMNTKGVCRECGHHYSTHIHQCIEWAREEIVEEIDDDENLKKRQGMEREQRTREEIKQGLNNKIASLDTQIDRQVQELRLVVDELSNLVMAPFNPHYLDYLETLKDSAKQNGDQDIAERIELEISNYKSFIKIVQNGIERVQKLFNRK
jgi:GTPase SAR1 family protein